MSSAIISLTQWDSEVFEHMEYMPYGETWIEEGNDNQKFLNYLFTSKEFDSETGLYYFGARYLDPVTSRWMSCDPIYDGVKDGLGLYTYCRNNPVIFHDPTGLKGCYVDPNTGNTEGYIRSPELDKVYTWIDNSPDKSNAGRTSGGNVENKGDSVQSKAPDKDTSQGDVGNNSRPKEPILQTDDSISYYVKDIDDNNKIKNSMSYWGCLFRSLQNIAEVYAGKNLTADEINKSREELLNSEVIRWDMWVNNQTEVVKNALNKLGVNDVEVSYNVLNGNYSIIHIIHQYNSGHFEAGDKNGKITFNPDPNLKTIKINKGHF